MSPGKEFLGRVEAPDKGYGGDLGSEPKPEEEAEAQIFSRESLSDELIIAAETPEELFIGLRLLERKLEDPNIPPGLTERYTPPRQLSAMYGRAEMMAFSIEELLKRGWITDYNPDTGEAKPKDERFAPLAIRVEVTERSKRGLGLERRYYFGKGEERKLLEKAYRRAILELEARHIMGEHVAARLSLDFRDSLGSLVTLMHSARMPKFKPEHLEALFNMPGLDELAENPENRRLGDQVEEAMFLYLVMLNSGNKQRMQDFLDRPGAKHLIAKLAKEKGQEYATWVKENIGDVQSWEDDNKRLLTDEGDNQATWRIEAADGRRGALTRWSNIVAWGGKPGEFGKDKEVGFIEGVVGGLVGSVEAARVAALMMRAIGAFASEGYVALPNGKSLLPLGESRFLSGDDTGKFWVYMATRKEWAKNRPAGLKEMIGRFPDVAMNLFDWAQVEVVLPDGTRVRRSIWDAWLGTAGDKPIISLLTGKETGKVTKEEPYQRLGDLNFRSLVPDFHGDFTTIQWLIGSDEGPTGVYPNAMNTEFKPEDFSLQALKKLWKYITITKNLITLTKGSPHLYDLGEKTEEQFETLELTEKGFPTRKRWVVESGVVETIQRRFMRNLIAARILSDRFVTAIMPETVMVYNTGSIGGDFLEVPFANMIPLFLETVLKPPPTTEEELGAHFVDDLARLQELTSWKKAGELRRRALGWFTDEVGRVTGKN